MEHKQSLTATCDLLGVHRQVYYRDIKSTKEKLKLSYKEINLVKSKRLLMPKIGTRKPYYLLEHDLRELNVGRDKLFKILKGGSLSALEMAVKKRKHKNQPMIHHSDRGLQYCSNEYQFLLEKKNGILPSMTEQYDPYENAIAERINGILKQEFEVDKYDTNLEIKTKLVKNAIETYNNIRPHLSNYIVNSVSNVQTK